MDESYQAITCTATDNANQQQNTKLTQELNKPLNYLHTKYSKQNTHTHKLTNHTKEKRGSGDFYTIRPGSGLFYSSQDPLGTDTNHALSKPQIMKVKIITSKRSVEKLVQVGHVAETSDEFGRDLSVCL